MREKEEMHTVAKDTSVVHNSGKTPASEKPVLSAPESETSTYVVTIDNSTGLAVKIEKLDEETGTRTEFTEGEYASAGYSPASGSYGPAYSAEDISLVQSYYRGVVDYLGSLTDEK